MLLLIGVSGLVIGLLNEKKDIVLVGACTVLASLLLRHMQGEIDRARLENEFAQLSPEAQAYWFPAIDMPELIPAKLQELLSA